MTNVNLDKSWILECSDEESIEITIEDKKRLYEKLSNGSPIKLEWKNPGRLKTKPEKSPQKVVVSNSVPVEQLQIKDTTATEFEFDLGMEDEIITPRRQFGNGRGPNTADRKIARLDKIMKDIQNRFDGKS